MSRIANRPSARAIADRFSPFSADYLMNPYPTLRELRETTRVFCSPALDQWVVMRTSGTTLNDERRFLNELAAAARHALPGRAGNIRRQRVCSDHGADKYRSARPLAPTPPSCPSASRSSNTSFAISRGGFSTSAFATATREMIPDLAAFTALMLF